jgi:cytochrome c oxidase subunit II
MLFAALLQVTASQSMLNPAGLQAHRISTLGWITYITFMAVALVMWVIVIWLAVRRRGTIEEHAPFDARGGEQWIIAGGLLTPVLILTVLFVLTMDTMSHFPIREGAGDPPAPDIEVIAHQWWWEIHYIDGPVDEHFTTANEIHIPVGRPMTIELQSADVMHSFWVPRLNGKMDFIPGEINTTRIEASQPGVFRGECSVFCGEQHAHMAMLVIAQSPSDYNAWVNDQRADAPTPATPQTQLGREVFLSGPCAFCHTVRGTEAMGVVAPDLTHIASRLSLASDTLNNTKANLAGWVTHAQSLKPGCEMPNLTQFTGVQLRDMVDYLETLR